ncbi:hypothetical protein, partial [Candidatus Viridilinea mediisalina]
MVRLLRWLTMGLVALLVVMLGGVATHTLQGLTNPTQIYAAPIGEVEPNDTLGTAQMLANIGLHHPVQGQIDLPGDQDFYSFTAVAGRSYAIELFNVANTLRPDGRACDGYSRSGMAIILYAPGTTQITSYLRRECDAANTSSGNTHNVLSFTAAVSGDFVIRVLANNTTVSGYYSLRILPRYGQDGAAWDEQTLEPNNSWVTAYELYQLPLNIPHCCDTLKLPVFVSRSK